MFIIAGKYYKKKIQAPPEDKTRPTSGRLRETLFNILQQEIEGVDFLDIFAGSGAIGIEALSRGAKSATFIESDRTAYMTLGGNLKHLNITKEAVVLYGDYVRKMEALGKQKAQFHIIFADAPYALESATEIVLEEVVKHDLLKASGRLFIENNLPVASSCKGLHHVNSRKSGKTYLHQFQK